MPERNSANGSALTSSLQHSGLEAVRRVLHGIGRTLNVTQLGYPIPFVAGSWENHNQVGTEMQPAGSTEPLHWREVGWIFRQGQCIAIEEKGPETRATIMVA